MSSRFIAPVAFLLALLFSPSLRAQSTYTAQLTGVITDSSGGVVPSAKVILTDEATSVPVSTTTNDKGVYVLTGLRPAKYTLHVDAPGFTPAERRGITLAVSQETTIDLSLAPRGVAETVTVTEQVPLLDTGSASLGTDVTNEYVRDIPLVDRSFFSLVFLAAGVTETAGQGTTDSYPTGTNFVSNGQRNSTAEIRVDGALSTAPEQGEGATTNVYWQPSVEIVQEFKVENNSFSSEFGNNGGTVINIVLKEGGNKFHGSGWWFGQRSQLDANEFFRNANGVPNPDHVRDQYGFSIGGPIKKEKTFFFVDFEKTRQSDPVNIDAFVPTAAERAGNFSQTQVICSDPTFIDPTTTQPFCTPNLVGNPIPLQVYNPFVVKTDALGNPVRPAFTNNVIPANLIDPIGQAIINMYPQPTVANAAPGTPNFHTAVLSSSPSRQWDVKLDHHFSDKHRISGRYSNLHSSNVVPTVFGDGDFNDGMTGTTDVHNALFEDNWSPTTTTVWTNRIALDRVVSPVNENYPKVGTVFNQPGDQILTQANNFTRFPTIQMDNNATSLFNQCCTDTGFAHTLVSYGSSLSWVRGRQIWKFGGEQRFFYNNFSQPQNPTGLFHFAQGVTEQVVGAGNSFQGDSFAALLLGYGDPGSSHLTVAPSVANKSKETAFYFQDDWKLTPKLTVNLGLRYEWSTPYDERNNKIQFSNFTGDSGISFPYTAPSPYPGMPNLLSRTGDLFGTTIFAGPGHRSIPVDRNNVAPRVGFAYAMDSKTVIRGGAGIYYGLNVATNFQFVGTAFGNQNNILFSTDNFQTRLATLANPFPLGFAFPNGKADGATALYGLSNGNSLDTTPARNAEIYQWNLGIQRMLPGQIVIGVDYSASRSTHLPYSSFSGTANRNFLPSSIREEIVSQFNACQAAPPPGGCVPPTTALNNTVPNPFLTLFVANPGALNCPGGFIPGPSQKFNVPSSVYNNCSIPLGNLLRPFPQFDGQFSGLTLLGASAFYNSMQVRFQKRANHYVSFEGNYTFSKAIDNSSAGANSFITTSLSSGIPQVYDNLKAEKSISANDATHRMVLATIVDLPVGRGRWIGRGMNRILDGVVGGWSASGILTFQTGTPIPIIMANGRIFDGNQRPNVLCPQLSSGISAHAAASNFLDFSAGQNVSDASTRVFNLSCFGDPGDQIAGNAPRYFSNLRSDGIHNEDVSLSKEFAIRESMKLQVRGEFFNFTNTPRFNIPGTGFGGGSFGQVTGTLGSPRHMQVGARFEF